MERQPYQIEDFGCQCFGMSEEYIPTHSFHQKFTDSVRVAVEPISIVSVIESCANEITLIIPCNKSGTYTTPFSEMYVMPDGLPPI